MIVYVSSTYRDFADHREVLRLALETSGYDFRGMEQFAAQQATPLEVSLAGLDGCEVYVGIIGDLYGSSPPGRVLSYTEYEYNRSLELDMYHIILVPFDDAPVNRKYIERDLEKVKRLERFRARVLRSHTAQNFRGPDDAAWRILAALRTYETRLKEQKERQA